MREPSSKQISTSSYRRSKPKQPQMQVSSSSKASRTHDRSFESRIRKHQTKERTLAGRSGGEKTVTFAPQSKPKPKPRPATDNVDRASYQRKDRRSASGNTFRGM
ncbi:hypothetical protein FQN49_004190 [Arthroderma sp. PD_2]|nr:hypothetical protein FQN49_004190 [Arthroderma sp. PD_2]